MDKLLSTIQKKDESVCDYIERFRNLSLMCPAGMPLPMLLQTCRHNFLDQVEIRMGAVKAYTWKELVEQAEIAEKLAKKFEPSTPKGKWGMNNKGRGDMAQSSQAKGKETISVELLGDTTADDIMSRSSPLNDKASCLVIPNYHVQVITSEWQNFLCWVGRF